MTPRRARLGEGGVVPDAVWEMIAASAGAAFTHVILLRHLG